jgi:hypothetical protein
MTGIAIEAGTAHPEFIPGFNGVRVSHSLVICVVGFFTSIYLFVLLLCAHCIVCHTNYRVLLAANIY